MLILTRKIDEEIIINGDVKIRVLSVSDGKVKIGVTAPDNVEILRGELYESIKEMTIEASKQSKHKVIGLTDLKINKIG